MKKGKNLFVFLFTLLLLVMSFTSVSLYDNAKENNTDRYRDIEYYYRNEFQLLTIDLAMQLDDNYYPINFENVEDDDQKFINDEFLEYILDTRSFINMDKDFYYIARNTYNNKMLTNIDNYDGKELNVEDYGYYIKVKYNEKGIVRLDGNASADIFSDMSNNRFIRNYGHSDIALSIENPTNFEIEFMIPKVNDSLSGISGYVNSWEQYNPFMTTLLVIISGVIILFIMIYPIRYIEISEPFKTIKTWSLEINCFVWSLMIGLGYVAMLVIGGNTINGNLARLLLSFGINSYNEIILAIDISAWIVFLFIVSIIFFLIKYIIVYGPIKYIIDHTLVASFIRYIQSKFKDITSFDLTSNMNTKVLSYIIINAIVICIILWFRFELGFILVLIYSFIIFIISIKKIKEIQGDYNNLLGSIKNIISEDFDEISEKDFGIFESSKNELNQLSENFEYAIQEKLKSQKLKTELVTNVSHDLKTPLTCIKNYIALLKDENITSEQHNYYLEQLTLYSNRLKNLIEDLFEISKVDSGNINLNIQELDIVSLLDQVYMENEELLEPKNLMVIKKYSADKLLLMLDSDKTYRIFENLFTNISKYALSNSRVYITLVNNEDSVDIEFSNISEVPMDFNIDEITERFVRGDKSRSKQGSGLGLAIARSFTEAQGGTFNISVDCDLFKVQISFLKKKINNDID